MIARGCCPLLLFALFSAGFAALHDVEWTGAGLASSQLGLEARHLGAESKSRRKRSVERERLFDSEEDYDEDDEKIMGSLFTRFLADSDQQLVLDLDLFRQLFAYSDAYAMGARDGDVDMMAIAVAAVERLKKFDISPGCVADVLHLAWASLEYATDVEQQRNCTECRCTPHFQQRRNERSWIFDVLDAMGKVPSGILGGNNLWIGSWNTCRKIHVVKNEQGQKWNGQYCLAHLSAYERDNPFKALEQSGPVDKHCHIPANSSSSGSSPLPEDAGKCFDLIPMLNFGVCVPDTCTDYDVTRIISFAIRMAEGAAGRDAVCDVAVECRREGRELEMQEGRHVSQSWLARLALYFVIFTIVMMIFGTLYHFFILNNQLTDLTTKEQKEFKNNLPTFFKVVLAYSVIENGEYLLNTQKATGEIDCLHGMRVLSMFWIILGHTYYYIGRSLTTDNLIPTLINFPKMFYTQIIVQAPLAVDSFFFLSGMLSAHLFFKRLFKENMRSAANPVIWLGYVVKRYTRLTPTYMVVMLLDVTLFTFISSGPFWRPIERTGCTISWWTNFIYMNNFLLQDQECCMGWTWFLANDMQLHTLITPLLVIAFSSKWFGRRGADSLDKPWYLNWGWVIGGLLLLASSISKLVIMLVNDYPPAPILTAKLQIVKKLDSYWNDVYIRPYVRCGPFIMGIMVAFVLNHYTRDSHDIKRKLSRKTLLIGWTVSTIAGLYSVFGLFNYAKTGDISEFGRILYVLAGRPAYALAISWVAFVCATGNGGAVNRLLGWKLFMPLSRITFCAYLLHPIMLQIYNLSRPQPFHFTTFFQMLRHAVEAIFVSYLLAFFFTLAFERPFGKFDEMLIPIDKGRGRADSTERQSNGIEEERELEPLNDTKTTPQTTTAHS